VLGLVCELLTLDLQPAYQSGASDPGRSYGMSVAGWNVRWRAEGETVEVYEARPV
jgi:hypothetical protein